MIFYFSGTGNSKYIADKLAACLDEKTIDIAKALDDNTFVYDCKEENYIGFVFPTYGWDVPKIVKEFIINLEFENMNESTYIFAVNNCGGSEGAALYGFNKMFLDKNINIDYARSVVLPDNYIIMFDTPDEETQKKTIRSANIKLANVINNISRRKKSVNVKFTPMILFYKAFNFVFTKFLNGTSKFEVKDNCIGCGLCKDICNSQAIEIIDNKPVWIKNSCVHCLACLNRCPVQAIEYGNKTEGKERYVNPLVKFDKTVEMPEDTEAQTEVAVTAEENTEVDVKIDEQEKILKDNAYTHTGVEPLEADETDSIFYSGNSDVDDILKSVSLGESEKELSGNDKDNIDSIKKAAKNIINVVSAEDVAEVGININDK